jgi:hypothetical protein
MTWHRSFLIYIRASSLSFPFTSLRLTFYNLLFATPSPKLAVVVVPAIQSAFKTESAEETVT